MALLLLHNYMDFILRGSRDKSARLEFYSNIQINAEPNQSNIM